MPNARTPRVPRIRQSELTSSMQRSRGRRRSDLVGGRLAERTVWTALDACSRAWASGNSGKASSANRYASSRCAKPDRMKLSTTIAPYSSMRVATTHELSQVLPVGSSALK